MVNPSIVIGKDFHVLNNVTLGGPNLTIGDNVFVGAGAIILSKNGLTIGDNAKIGAGAVVVKDVPPDAVMVGNPARNIRKMDETGVLQGKNASTTIPADWSR